MCHYLFTFFTGIASGTLLGGVGIDKFGCRTTFLYAAELSFLLLIINLVISCFFFRIKGPTKQEKLPISSITNFCEAREISKKVAA